jgi:cell division protein FtsL
LDVERGAQATPLRVEKLAREQLRMQTISPAISQYVAPHAAAVESAAAAAGKEQP